MPLLNFTYNIILKLLRYSAKNITEKSRIKDFKFLWKKLNFLQVKLIFNYFLQNEVRNLHVHCTSKLRTSFCKKIIKNSSYLELILDMLLI